MFAQTVETGYGTVKPRNGRARDIDGPYLYPFTPSSHIITLFFILSRAESKTHSTPHTMSETVTNGACYCGAVKVTAVGDPKAVLVCHCRDCARWFGSLNMATLFERDKVTVTGETVEVTNTPPEGKDQGSYRTTCVKCKGNVLNDHPGMGLTDVCSGILDRPFEPAFHINYQSATWKIKDGLPKFKDLPAPFGGSDETMPE